MILRQVWFFFVSQIFSWAMVMLSLAQFDIRLNQIGLYVFCFSLGLGAFYLLRKRFLNASGWVRAIILVLTFIGAAAIPMAASNLFR